MKINLLKTAVMALVVSVLLTSCKSKQTATTPQQKAAVTRGIKMEKEECEELAMKNPKRASGSGLSQSER